jgi:hypothetical protein
VSRKTGGAGAFSGKLGTGFSAENATNQRQERAPIRPESTLEFLLEEHAAASMVQIRQLWLRTDSTRFYRCD